MAKTFKFGVNSQANAITLARTYFPEFLAHRGKAIAMETWYRGKQKPPDPPASATAQEKALLKISTTDWARLVVLECAQNLYVEGYRSDNKSRENSPLWRTFWQSNRLDSRQIAQHNATLAHGLAYAKMLPGTDPLTGSAMPVWAGRSALKMAAFYAKDGEDEWPLFSIDGELDKRGDHGEHVWHIVLTDENYDHIIQATGGTQEEPENWTYIEPRLHKLGITPIIRFANTMDLDGVAVGEIEPFIPIFGRLDQDTYHRLVVQDGGSWKVRWAAGIAMPKDATEEEGRQKARKLSATDFLMLEDPGARAGAIDASSLDGYINSKESDLRDLSGVSQTPAHHLLGVPANLSADALAAAEASLTRKVVSRRHVLGESWEQCFRLGAYIVGDKTGAGDFAAQVRWTDTESRSLAQAAAALGTLATQVSVPFQMLWDRIPNWTDQDTQDALAIIEKAGAKAQLIAALGGARPGAGQPGDAGPARERERAQRP